MTETENQFSPAFSTAFDATVMTDGCDWPVDICDDCCTDALAQLDPARVELIKLWASDFMWRATGQRYGLCTRTIRPCRRECDSFGTFITRPFQPVRISGDWYNLSCGTCSGTCGCDVVSEVWVDDTESVLAVTVDGVSLVPEDTVVVYDRSRIVRIDGEPWPSCQNLSVPTNEPGSWSITVQTGRRVPPGGALAAGILACELAKACIGDKGCRLPKRIQTLTRQEVTVTFQDQFESLSELRTGLWEVDAFIESVRSTRWRQPTITSPDLPDPTVQTWPVVV